MGRTNDAAKGTEEIVDDDYFVKQYQQMTNKGKERVQKKRTKIRRDHAARVEALRSAIESIASKPLGANSPECQGSGEPLSYRKSALETLGHLLQRKNSVEKRIALSIGSLEAAFNTTSKEVRVGMNARAGF